MSMTGQRRLALERARLEALRLEQVRQDCTAIIAACTEALRSVRDIAVQQLAAPSLRRSADTLGALRSRVATSPDAVREELLSVTVQIQEDIAQGEAEARAWSVEQTRAVARAREAQMIATAAGEGASEALALGRQAAEYAERGELDGATRLTAAARTSAAAASAAILDERVRREVARGLMKTLKDMGFTTIGPHLDAGLVVLEGRLASGRRARFEVSLDGTMSFDLDGYEGRSCADDFEKVETTMRDRFGVKLGPPQVVWKNPERIGKGARDLPKTDTKRR